MIKVLEGVVESVSHSFRVQANGPTFFIKLVCPNDMYRKHIIVVDIKTINWTKPYDIRPGYYYKFTNLFKCRIFKTTYNIPVFTTTSSSKKEILFEIAHHVDIAISIYKGVISRVINEDHGLYELKDGSYLLLLFLVGVTTEFYQNSILKEGDEIQVFDPHYLNKDEKQIITCCGRSFMIVKDKDFDYDASKPHSRNAIVKCVNHYNFGVSFYFWLSDFEAFMLDSLPDDIDPSYITRYNSKGKVGFFQSLFAKLKLFDIQKRSLTQEFLLEDHCCVAEKEFDPPFDFASLTTLPSKKKKFKSNYVNERPVWCCSETLKNEHKLILFGVFTLANGNYFKLKNKHATLNVVVVESEESDQCFNFLDKFVAVKEYDIVEEFFDIRSLINEELTKTCIIVESKNIILLNKATVKDCIPRHIESDSSKICLRILNKSGLNFDCCKSLKSEKGEAFFVCKASISVSGKDGFFNTFIRFRDKLSSLYPILKEGMVVTGYLSSHHDISVLFRKQNISLLKPMAKFFCDFQCVDFPSDFQIHSLDTMKSTYHSIGVSQLVNGEINDQSLYFVEGIVMQKTLMTPMFESEKLFIPSKLLNSNVGIPGSKIMLITLQDTFDLEAKVSLYYSGGNAMYLPQYPLGVVPGVTIRASSLQKNVSLKGGAVYLSSTMYSSIDILTSSSSDTKSTGEVSLFRYFLSKLTAMPPGSVVHIIATVSTLLNIKFKSICPTCQSDFLNGSCTYIGCHSTEPGEINFSAKFGIEDGTDNVIVFTKESDHLRQLSCLNDLQWNVLLKAVGNQNIELTYDDLKNGSHFDPIKNGLVKIFRNPQIIRPVHLTGRLFPKKSSAAMFLLDFKQLNPNLDKRYLN